MTRKKSMEQLEVDVQDAVEAVRRLAVDGVAPTTKGYNAGRRDAPSVETLARAGVRYSEVVLRAGVSPAAPGPSGRVPAETERWIRHRQATAEPPAPSTWPLFGIPTRRRVIEQRVVGEDAEGVLVAVRVEEWFSLR